MRLNASRGSAHNQATNSRIARSQVRWPLADVRLFSTTVLACSRSGRASTRLGDFFLRDLDFRVGRPPSPSPTASLTPVIHATLMIVDRRPREVIGDHPVLFTLLNRLELQGQQLSTA